MAALDVVASRAAVRCGSVVLLDEVPDVDLLQPEIRFGSRFDRGTRLLQHASCPHKLRPRPEHSFRVAAALGFAIV